MRKCWLTGTLLLAAHACALAQDIRTGMPEGSSDIVFALAAVAGPRAIGSAETRLGVVPLMSVQWANGIFINMNTLGMQLSERGDLRYGPLLTPTRSRVLDADGQPRSRFTPQLGGFVEYEVSRGLNVSTRLMYGGSSDRRGAQLRGAASAWTSGQNHHAFGVEALITLANRSALQKDFALPNYQVHGGLRDASLKLHWSWELTHKSTLHSWVEEQRFLGSARSSPRLERHGGTSVASMVSWRF